MVAGTSAYRILSNGKRTRKAVVCSHEPATQRRLMLFYDLAKHCQAWPRGQPDLRLLADLFFGTFLPALRASDKPIAMAWLRLVTLLPERPLLKVPRLRSCIAFATFLDAASLYFLAMIPPQWVTDITILYLTPLQRVAKAVTPDLL
jgi:hypothetical protein